MSFSVFSIIRNINCKYTWKKVRLVHRVIEIFQFVVKVTNVMMMMMMIKGGYKVRKKIHK